MKQREKLWFPNSSSWLEFLITNQNKKFKSRYETQIRYLGLLLRAKREIFFENNDRIEFESRNCRTFHHSYLYILRKGPYNLSARFLFQILHMLWLVSFSNRMQLEELRKFRCRVKYYNVHFAHKTAARTVAWGISLPTWTLNLEPNWVCCGRRRLWRKVTKIGVFTILLNTRPIHPGRALTIADGVDLVTG